MPINVKPAGVRADNGYAMRALSIRQPYVELILRGVERIEYRSRATRIIGERFFIYASKGGSWKDEVRKGAEAATAFDRMKNEGRKIVADNVVVPIEPPAAWMMELARLLILGDL